MDSGLRRNDDEATQSRAGAWVAGAATEWLGSMSVMSVTVRIPTTLRPLTAGAASVSTTGATVSDVLADLEARHPGLRERVLDESGALRRFVNVFVDDEDVRFLDGPATEVPAGSTVAIVPAVAGGAG